MVTSFRLGVGGFAGPAFAALVARHCAVLDFHSASMRPFSSTTCRSRRTSSTEITRALVISFLLFVFTLSAALVAFSLRFAFSIARITLSAVARAAALSGLVTKAWLYLLLDVEFGRALRVVLPSISILLP